MYRSNKNQKNIQRKEFRFSRTEAKPIYFDTLKEAGFTILETLVAISILVIALTAPLAIVSQALKSSYFARDQVTAYYLAQEAIEFLRNKRDNAGLQSSASAETWTNLFLDELGTPLINAFGSSGIKAYLVRDSSGYKLRQCTSGSSPVPPCPPVSYNPNALTSSSGEVIYGDSSAIEDSVFIREIEISEPPAGSSVNVTENNPSQLPGNRELIVTVRVRWKMADGSYTDGITLREHLTNWQLEKTPPTTP